MRRTGIEIESETGTVNGSVNGSVTGIGAVRVNAMTRAVRKRRCDAHVHSRFERGLQ